MSKIDHLIEFMHNNNLKVKDIIGCFIAKQQHLRLKNSEKRLYAFLNSNKQGLTFCFIKNNFAEISQKFNRSGCFDPNQT